MVISLPYIARCCDAEHRSSRLHLQVQDPGWQVPFVSSTEGRHTSRLRRGLECLAQIGQAIEEKETVRGSKYKQMFELKALHLLAFFSLVYVGVEVTISGKPSHLSRFLRRRLSAL